MSSVCEEITSIRNQKWILPDIREPFNFAVKSSTIAWKDLLGHSPDLREIVQFIEIFTTEILIPNQSIGIVGDYDVDGISATVLLCQYLRSLQLDPLLRLPNRYKDGYGLTPKIVQEFYEKNIKCIITLDNGTTAYEAVALAKEYGMFLLVLDHHAIQDEISVDCLINARKYQLLQNLCATGITFIFVRELHLYLKKKYGNFRGVDLDKIETSHYLDLVAVATICDMVILDDLNKDLVAGGLRLLQNKEFGNLGLKLLIGDSLATSSTIGFKIGPHINAPGRLGYEEKILEFLLTNDLKKAEVKIAEILAYNIQRKELQKQQLESILLDPSKKILIVCDQNLSIGLIGIIAGQLKSQYDKPTCIITKNGSNHVGSMRSNDNFNIGEFIKTAKSMGLISHGGGHVCAGGFTTQDPQKFIQWTEEYVNAMEIIPNNMLYINQVITLGAVETWGKLQYENEPFGQGKPKPKFLIPNVMMKFYDYNAKVTSNLHANFILKNGYITKWVSVFNINGQNKQFLELCRKESFRAHLLVELDQEKYQGQTKTSIRILDVKILNY